MDAKRIRSIVQEWVDENFTFVDEVAVAQLIARLQEEELDYRPCPHGAKRIDCAHCDHLEDMNFDAARERAFRSR